MSYICLNCGGEQESPANACIHCRIPGMLQRKTQGGSISSAGFNVVTKSPRQACRNCGEQYDATALPEICPHCRLPVGQAKKPAALAQHALLGGPGPSDSRKTVVKASD